MQINTRAGSPNTWTHVSSLHCRWKNDYNQILFKNCCTSRVWSTHFAPTNIDIWKWLRRALYLLCPALIGGMMGLRSAHKPTLSSRHSRQIKNSLAVWLWNTFPPRAAGKEAKMDTLKLIIFPQWLRGDNSCHVSCRKHNITRSPRLVRISFKLPKHGLQEVSRYDTNTPNEDFNTSQIP